MEEALGSQAMEVCVLPSGVRILTRRGDDSSPAPVTCRLVTRKHIWPPPLMEGEALASKMLEMLPTGDNLPGPVLIEVPHFASLRNSNREVIILRNENSWNWERHPTKATDDALKEAFGDNLEGIEIAEDLHQKQVTRILTRDIPRFFAIVTRIVQNNSYLDRLGGVIHSSVVPQVQVDFPPETLNKPTEIGLQALPIPPEVVSKLCGDRVTVSPVVTVEPRRRKFRGSVTLSIPLPGAAKRDAGGSDSSAPPHTLRLVCSITGGTARATWDDITGVFSLKLVGDCVQFKSTVSARFWMIDCPKVKDAAKMAAGIYQEVLAVPFMAKFVVLARRHEREHARLRVFCMCENEIEKALQSDENFTEVGRSEDMEVFEGRPWYIEVEGNLALVTSPHLRDQFYSNFHAFQENPLSITVQIQDPFQAPLGKVVFMHDPKPTGQGDAQNPICTLNIIIPDTIHEDEMLPTDVRLSVIAAQLGGDWAWLGNELGLAVNQIRKIREKDPGQQPLAMLQAWIDQTNHPTGSQLEAALELIGREDIIRKWIAQEDDVVIKQQDFSNTSKPANQTTKCCCSLS